MAIDAYTGNPRSGKSYSVVKNVILPSLREGRTVFTNIPLTEKAHAEFPGLINQLPPDWFSNPNLADTFTAGSVVVLDELWRRWPSGIKVNAFPFKDKEFLAEHGHNVDSNGNTTRVVLVTQDLGDIASFARGKVDKTYRTQKLDAVGADNRFRVDIYEGPVTGPKPPKTQFIRSVFDKYEPSYYDYYKSSTKSQTGDTGNESRADKRANIWRSPFIIFSIIGPVFGIPLLLWYVSGIFTGGFGMAEAAKGPELDRHQTVNAPPPTALPAAVSSVEQVVEQPIPTTARLSTLWRVSGYLQRSKDQSRPAGWDSKLGYGRQPETIGSVSPLQDMVLLHSEIHGNRRVLASDCELLSDGFNWQCEIDGAIATPWTGRGDSTNWAADTQTLTSRTVSVARSSGDQQTNPAPQ